MSVCVKDCVYTEKRRGRRMVGEQGGTAGWEAKVRPLRKLVKAPVSIFHQRGTRAARVNKMDGRLASLPA